MEISPLLRGEGLVFDKDNELVACDHCFKKNAMYELEIAAYIFVICPECVQYLRNSIDLIEEGE